jgi:predicted negative regulator of RcsB-dependent stress response
MPGGASASTPLEILDPDGFQESVLSGWHWVERHAGTVGGLILVGLLILTGITVKNWLTARGERKAQEAYYAAERKFSKVKEGFDRAKMRLMVPAAAAPKDEKNPEVSATGDLEKDYGTVLSDLEKIVQTQGGTSAGAQAAILLAETYLTYNKPEKAVAVTELAAKTITVNLLLGALVRVQLGSALAAKGDCKTAVNVWGQVLTNASSKFLHADVSLRSGICFEQISEFQKAKEMYQKAAAEAGPDSSISSTAKGLERALDLKTKS